MTVSGDRVVTLEIPPAPRGVPISWNGHLSDEAIAKARANFAIRHRNAMAVDEVESWDDTAFLDRAGLTVDGKLKTQYIRTRAQDDAHYKKLVADFIERFGEASRDDIDELLLKHLSDVLDDDQKRTKVSNLLTAMRRAGTIYNAGSRAHPNWKLGPEPAE